MVEQTMKQIGPDGATLLLKRWKEQGDTEAQNELFALMQGALQKIAAGKLRGEQSLGYKIDPRELVNEAFLRLRQDYPIVTDNRAPFVVLMIKAMRHFLIDQARADQADKRPPSELRIIGTQVF